VADLTSVVSVVVADDHPATIAGIEAWCAEAEPPVRVVDSGASVAVAWTDPGASADVVVLDLQLGGLVPAFADLRRLVDVGRQVVVYTMREDRDTALNCIDIGAFVFLTKAEGPAHLIAAIRAAAATLPYTSPSMARAIGDDARQGRPRLTQREIDVLVNWFASESKEMVARKLNLSVSSVNTYINRVRIKYANAGREAPTKAALVARAIQDGLVSLDEL
jgi:DNA-binding NarL/FixJ family response regulator